MLRERIENIKLVLKSNNLDAILISSAENVFYLSGFTGGLDGELLITEKNCYIITDSRYYLQAKEECPDFILSDTKDGFTKLIVEEKIKTMGVEDEVISAKRYGVIEKKYPVELVGISENIAHLRVVKDKTEIFKIANAAKIADLAFEYILKEIKPGITEKEIAIKLESFMQYQGASKPSFETIVASGYRSAMPHGTASSKIIEKGDVVLMDYGCVFEGYCSDMTRCVFVGKASSKQKEIYNIVLDAQKEALCMVKSDVAAKIVDLSARSVISKAGYGDFFTHSTGHGVGVALHEPLYVSPSSKNSLPQNTILTVEPGIYIDGEFGIRIEDLVRVDNKCGEILSSSTKEMITI